MSFRAPAVPLVTVDPYFSLWSMKDTLNGDFTRHWTGKPMPSTGIVKIDNTSYCFMGYSPFEKMKQNSVDINALSTKYSFSGAGIELKIIFTTPLLMDDLYIMSRPCSYIRAEYVSMDGKNHDVELTFSFSDEFCINLKGELETEFNTVDLGSDFTCARTGSVKQPILKRCGDDLRIEWGYFYVAAKSRGASVYGQLNQSGSVLYANFSLKNNDYAMLVLAYDDIYSIEYFGEKLKAYWKTNGDSIEDVIRKSINEYDALYARCESFSGELNKKAVQSGGEKYADILSLAYRQAIAGHKLVADTNGEVLFISKENFSNGCAATVDVSYPSIPLFLLYNPELVKGMMRPIYKYASGPVWPFVFAPHDAGTYPLVNGQVYSNGTRTEWQMPIEECGNMLVMAASVSVAEKDASFAEQNLATLKMWADYLVKNGVDPENQLCTDDFAGHLAHNCNLSVKAIMGIAGYSIICGMLGKKDESDEYFSKAHKIAETWVKNASNGDGTYKLAFDQEGTYSMKYNAVWDQLFNTNLFPKDVIKSEFDSYISRRLNKYGMPLDNRKDYTKSDWLVWSATLADKKEDFEKMIEGLWLAYNDSESRVPMTDWYDTVTARQCGFQNRTVQGGLFIKLLKDSEKCSYI